MRVLFIEVGLQRCGGTVVRLEAGGVKVRQDMRRGRMEIAEVCHFVYTALGGFQPLADTLRDRYVRLGEGRGARFFRQCFPEHLLRPTLISLFGEAGGDPLLLSLSVDTAVQDHVVFAIFDLQTSCHKVLLSNRRSAIIVCWLGIVLR